MSAADFLLAPEVQKILRVVFAEPSGKFSVQELASRSKLPEHDVERTREHLVRCGILCQHEAKGEAPVTVAANTSFIFYGELRSIALKSFAAAEPIRAMLRSKFKDSVLRAFLLGEDKDAMLELLVVHGEMVPDEGRMAVACRKLSGAIGRHLRVQVISSRRYRALMQRGQLQGRPAGAFPIEIIAEGDTRARPPVERRSILQAARQKLKALGS
jgi:hypothetical protein